MQPAEAQKNALCRAQTRSWDFMVLWMRSRQKYTVHTLAISSMLVLSEQNLTFGLQQQRPWQKGRSCSSKGRRLEQQALQYLRVPPRLFDSFALTTHTKSGRYEQVRRKLNNRRGWNGSNTGKTSSKNTASGRKAGNG